MRGHELLDRLKEAVSTYVALPSLNHLVAVTLWVATTHAIGSFDYAPRLVVRSAEKRSGKSRLLEVVDGTCHKPLRTVNATVAAIFRSLDSEDPPTLLMDEADTIFGSRKVAENNEDLRGLLNAGYQRGLPVLRTVGPKHEVKEFHTFAMAALAGIGQMPDTIEDRAVVVVMRRRKPSEPIMPYRIRRDQPKLHRIRDDLAAWAEQVGPVLEAAMPDMPLEDRAADTWEPLVAVADAAGGQWPDLARQAATALTNEAQEADGEASLDLKLLWDIQTIFENKSVTFIPSLEMIDHLHAVEESPWKDFDFTPSKLGHRLRKYEIRTGHNTDRTARGYRREDFQDAFERYPRPNPSGPVQGAESHGKQADAFESMDTFKASSETKASVHKPHVHAANKVRTPLDTLPATNKGVNPFETVQAPKTYEHNTFCVPCKQAFGPHLEDCPKCNSELVPPGKEIPA